MMGHFCDTEKAFDRVVWDFHFITIDKYVVSSHI